MAEIIDGIEGRPYGTGRPSLPTIRVVETLRFFLREGVQWRELRAVAGRRSPVALVAPSYVAAQTSGRIILALLSAACIFIIANRISTF